MIQGLTSLLGAGLDIYGQFRQQHQQNWQNGLTMEQFNRRNLAQDRGVEAWNASADPARDTSLQLRDLFMSALSGDQGSQAQLSQLLTQYPGVLDRLVGSSADPFSRGTSDGMSSLINQNSDRRGAYAGAADTAMAGFQGGGWTQPRADSQDRFMDMLLGRGAEAGTLGDVGTSLLGQRGQTAHTQGLQDRATDAVAAGGMNDQLQQAWASLSSILGPEGATETLSALQSGGRGLFDRQGMNAQNIALYNRGLAGLSGGALGTAGLTKAGGAAELQGLLDIQEGGETALTQALAGRGMNLANREALLSPEEALNIAREEAARNAEGAFKRAQRQALARKGGSASVVAAGGAEEDPMTEWADLASRAVSDAGRQALLGQQGLQLQQQGQGAQMASQAGGLANSRYGAAGDLVRGMEGNATQRYNTEAGVAGAALNNALGYAGLGSQTALGAQEQETRRFLTALGILPDISNSATHRLSTFGQLGLGAGSLENNRMGTGIGALNSFQQGRQAGGQLMNNAIGDQGQYALGLGNLGMGLENSYQQSGNNLFGQLLQGGKFGSDLNQRELEGNQQFFNNTHTFNRDNLQGGQQGVSNLFNLAGQGLQYAMGGLGGGTYQPANMQQSPWSSLGKAIGNVNFGGLFNNGYGPPGSTQQMPVGMPNWTPPSWGTRP